MIVVAHPDDETIGLGAQLGRFDDALLVHVTDGAPRDGVRRAQLRLCQRRRLRRGATGESLTRRCAPATAARLRRLGFGIPDKEAWRDLAGLARRLAELLRAEDPRPYSRTPMRAATPTTTPPPSPSMPRAGSPTPRPPLSRCRSITAATAGSLPASSFRPSSLSRRKPESISPTVADKWSRPSPGRIARSRLTGEALRRKARMIDCFATQRWLLEQFDLATERFRVAPEYDFRQPPHPGELHYETLGWGIAGAEWRRDAADALDRLGPGPIVICEEHSDEAISLGREIASRACPRAARSADPFARNDG